MVTVSPVWTAPIGPPWTASGATWATMKPWVAPEKRPSGMRAPASATPPPPTPARPARAPRTPSGDGQHLAHAGAAGRALVADDDDVAGLDLALRHGGHRRFLVLEHGRGALVVDPLVAGELHDAAVGREVAAQDREAAGGLDRVVDRADDDLALGLLRLGGVLADRAAGDGHRVLVEPAELLQALDDDGDAAGLVQVGGDVAAAGLEVAQHRGGRADAVEVVDVEVDPRLAGDRQQVQDAVGGAAGGGARGDRVLEPRLGDDLARALAAREHVHYELAGLVGDLGLARVLGRDHRGAHGADAEHLERHRHRVGGELAAAGAGARAGDVLEVDQLLLGDAAGGVGADRLEDLLDRHVLALVLAGHDRAAIEHQARQVEPRERHRDAGERLVTGGEADDGVEEVAAGDELDRVSDHLAGDEAPPHAARAPPSGRRGRGR